MIGKCVLLTRLRHIVGQTDGELFVHVRRQLIESRDERMFHPIDQQFDHQHEEAVGEEHQKLFAAPIELFHRLNDNHEQ